MARMWAGKRDAAAPATAPEKPWTDSDGEGVSGFVEIEIDSEGETEESA